MFWKKPNKSEEAINKAMQFASKNDVESAFKAIEYALTLEPNNGRAYAIRGALWKNEGKISRALRDFEKAIELGDHNPHTFSNMGWIFLLTGDWRNAIKFVDVVLDLSPSEMPSVTYLIASSVKGWALMQLGELSSEYVIKAAKLASTIGYDANMSPLFLVIKVLGYELPFLSEAYKLLEAGNATEAIAEFTKAIEVNRKLFIAYQNRGYAYGALKRYEDSMRDLNFALKNEPYSLYGYYYRGIIHLAMKNTEKAKADFGKFVQLGGNRDELKNEILKNILANMSNYT
jgi:tetratricopeptide (TPR) repeat protein